MHSNDIDKKKMTEKKYHLPLLSFIFMEVWYKVCPYPPQKKKKIKEGGRKKEGESNATSCSSPPEHNTILNE